MNLARVNLNLLVALQALLDECNVTRAAARLHITQSAMSKNLAQLRRLLEDPLLVRTSDNHLQPTARAQALKGRLDHWLQEAEIILAQEEFDPSECHQHFVVAATDYVAQFIFPDILQDIYQQAPNIGVELVTWNRDGYEAMAHGRIDIAACILDRVPANIQAQKFGGDQFVCLFRRDHPLDGKGLTVADYINYPHVAITGGGDKVAVIDKALAELGLKRRVKLQVPYFSSALQMASHTDLLLTLPRCIAEHLGQQFPVVMQPLPFAVPELSYSLVWHLRYQQHPAHRWLRGLLHKGLLNTDVISSVLT